MYQELKILRSPPQWEFCTKGKGDSNGRIETGAAEKKLFAVDSHIPNDHGIPRFHFPVPNLQGFEAGRRRQDA